MMKGIFGMIGGMVTLLLTLLLSFLQFDLFGFSPSNSTAVGLGVLLGLVLMILGVLWMVAGAGLLRGLEDLFLLRIKNLFQKTDQTRCSINGQDGS